eukprot:gene10656-biopygen8525
MSAVPREAPATNLRNYIVNSLRNVCRDVENYPNVDGNVKDYASYRLEHVALLAINCQRDWPNVIDNETTSLINTAQQTLKNSSNDEVPVIRTKQGNGRPSLEIPKETLLLYFHYGFPKTKIAEMLSVSVKAVSRRIQSFGLEDLIVGHADIQDCELDHAVQEIFASFPNCGIRRMKGFLLSRGLNIQWDRVRESMWLVDPTGLLLRTTQLNTLQGRKYSVPGTLAVWHVDGNHKLIRWRFVVHGAIDGYSRHIMYMRCSTNNKAQTVMALFLDAVTRSEHNKTPLQLWVQGQLNYEPVQEEIHNAENLDTHGVDWDGPTLTESCDNDTIGAQVPELNLSLSNDMTQRLQLIINKSTNHDLHGVEDYLAVRNAIKEMYP